jgi:ADP-ribose pyrophosphatase
MKRTLIHRGKIATLVKLNDRWEVVEHAAAVAVLVVREGRVLGVRQFRPAIGQETWELPAGLVDAGESPLEAAERELAEEVKLRGSLTLVAQGYSSPGFTDEKVYLFEARDLAPYDGEPDYGEGVTPEWRDLRETWQAIQAGEVASSYPTLLGLALALGRAEGKA